MNFYNFLVFFFPSSSISRRTTRWPIDHRQGLSFDEAFSSKDQVRADLAGRARLASMSPSPLETSKVDLPSFRRGLTSLAYGNLAFARARLAWQARLNLIGLRGPCLCTSEVDPHQQLRPCEGEHRSAGEVSSCL